MLTRTLLSAVALLGTAAPAPPPPQAQSSGASGTTIAPGATEGVEILRRILAETLDQAFRPVDDGRETNRRLSLRTNDGYQGLVTTLWAGEQTVTHSRAFQVPGSGLFFQLDLSLPVVAKKSEVKPAQPTPADKDDEWERMRREVRGDTRGGLSGDFFKLQTGEGPELEIDPASIERVTEHVLKTVARHASRIEGLGSQDVITVALHLSGKTGTAWSTLEPPVRDPLPDGEEHEDDPHGFSVASGYFATGQQLLFAAAHEAPEQRLIVQVTVADVSGYAEGGYTRLRDRARVVHY